MRVEIKKTSVGLEIRLSDGERDEFCQVLAGFKKNIRYRRFDRIHRVWRVPFGSSEQVAQWAGWAHHHFGVEIVVENTTENGPGTALSDAYSILHLLPTAPSQLVRAAYRCLAKIHHPDAGGNVAAMQELNGAYTELSKNMQHHVAGDRGKNGNPMGGN